MKTGYGVVHRLTQAEVDAGKADAINGARIEIIDANGAPTGVAYESGAAGVAPTLLVTGNNINAVLQSTAGIGWEKVQANTANYAIVRPTTGASLDLHIEVGGTLAALTVANWPIPAGGVDQLRIRNMSAVAQSFTATGFSGIVTADGNAATSGSYSIPVDMAVHITIDEDGWIQVTPMGQEVSQSEMDSGLAGKANTGHAHTGTYEPANSNIQTHVAAAHAPATAEQNVQPDWNAASGDAQILNKPTIPAAVTVNNTLNSTSTTEALSANQGKVLQDGKQATLVSGTNIKTVNGASVVGSGNVTIASDLPGGTPTTLSDEGLVSGTATIDRTTVSGQTILSYTTPGATTFTPPAGVTNIEYLVVAGGGGGGYAQAAGRSAGGGGAGGLRAGTIAVTQQSYAVAVGGGGLAGTSGTPHGGNGGAASIGALVSTVGGGGGGNGAGAAANAGNVGGSGGGGSSYSTPGAGGAGTAGEGNNGGAGDSDNEGGGGGGASAAGGVGDTTTNIGGAGGAGSASTITGVSVTYAGGGGGGALSSTVPAGTGGAGGAGGGGAGGTSGAGVAGEANKGGGGGGAGASDANGGAGGSGIIIVRFPTQTRTYNALTSFADNAAALAGSKKVGEFYRKTSDGSVQQVQ